MKVLVTGGAGFIGSFIVDELPRRGHQVRIFDNLDPQVHPNSANRLISTLKRNSFRAMSKH